MIKFYTLKTSTFAFLYLLIAPLIMSAQTYCAAGPTSIADTEIRDVYLSGDNYGISNPTTCPTITGLRNFTQLDSADLSRGTSYSLEALLSTCGDAWGSFARAWIDYNGDGDFTDAGEELGTWSGTPAPVSSTVRNAFISFAVPPTATLGRTRIRVMLRESGTTTSTTPCATFSWGAVHDYTIRITNTPPSSCPITALPTVASVASCGGLPVTLNATWSNPANKVFWTGVNGRPNGIGASYTTGNISTTGATVSAQLYARNNIAAAVSGGPSIAAFAASTTVGYTTAPSGNFTNGFGIDVAQPFTLDSATVRAFATAVGGKVKFVVRVFERQGPITAGTLTPAGKLIAFTDTITVTSTSTTGQNFRVPVGLDLVPGRYHIQLGFAAASSSTNPTGNTGRLYRSTALPTGNSYPFAIGTLGSVDSVAWAGAPRVYYLFDLKATPGCTGPAVTVNVPYLNTITSVPYVENFNNGIPCTWAATAPSGATWQAKAGYTGNGYTATTLNGTSFVMVDDDAAGASGATTNSALTTPSFPALGYDTLTMKFKSVFLNFVGYDGKGYLEVWRPVNGVFGWLRIDSIKASEGIGTPATGWAAVTKTYNVTAYQSNDFKARFVYDDRNANGVSNWAGFWAIDDFELDGTLSPTGNVRVAITTDIYGSEISWLIRNTANNLVYASGGPYQDVSPYNAAAATHIDTVAIPLTGNYEFRLNDSWGDGLFDGANTGTYLVEKLCSWGTSIIDSGSGANDNDPGGATGGIVSYDSAVFDMSCVQYKNVTFNVDMNRVSQTFVNATVGSNSNNWWPWAAMTDANGDNIWEATLSLPVGFALEYKYGTEDPNVLQEQNDPTAPCTNGNATNTNRVLVVPATDTVLNVVCWSSCTSCPVDVTFNVDMNQVSQTFVNATVGSNSNNWWPWAAMTDANGDNIWEATLSLPVGFALEYKYGTEDPNVLQEQNDPTAPCTNGNATNTNRVLVIPATDTVLNVVCWSQCTACDVDVTLKVNMAWEKANNAISTDGIHVAGDFQGPPSGAFTEMLDTNNDGIYEVTLSVPANSSIQYTFINGNTIANSETVPTACVGPNNIGRVATFAYGDSTMSPVCFGKCTDCAVGLGESLQNVSLFPNPTRGQFNLARMDAATEVEVSVLDLQGKVLTVAKWNEGVDALSIDLSSFANGVYMVRMTSEEGSRTMRVSVQK